MFNIPKKMIDCFEESVQNSVNDACREFADRVCRTYNLNKMDVMALIPDVRTGSGGTKCRGLSITKFSTRNISFSFAITTCIVISTVTATMLFSGGLRGSARLVPTIHISKEINRSGARHGGRSICSAQELVHGHFENGTWVVPSNCKFLTFPEMEHCMSKTDFLIGGNSISRAIHYVLLKELKYEESFKSRVAQKVDCPLPFEQMFDNHPELYNNSGCSRHQGESYASFIWVVDCYTQELRELYETALKEANTRGRALLVSINVMTNRCWPKFHLSNETCIPQFHEQYPIMIHFFNELFSLDNNNDLRHSFIYRTNTHVLQGRPEEVPAMLLNDWIMARNQSDHGERTMILDMGKLTDHPGIEADYDDSIHPNGRLTELTLRMMLHLHCK
jgi:hypothetical protein